MKRKILLLVTLVLAVLLVMSSVSFAFYSVPTKSVSMNKTALILGVGLSSALDVNFTPENATNQNVTWSSSNKAVATVSSSGTVKGIKAGTATITAKTADKKFSAKCTVTVVAKLAPAKLVYNTPFFLGPTKEMDLVFKEVDKQLTKKINATIKINNIPIGSYVTKMSVINSSGEYYDMCFTDGGGCGYYKYVSQDVFLGLNDLLPKYAPNLWKLVPKKFWDAARVKGKIYAAINYQICAGPLAWSVDLTFMKMVEQLTGKKFDYTKWKKIEDLEPYLKAIREANIPKSNAYTPNDPTVYGPIYFNADVVGDPSSPGWIKLNDSTLTVYNQYESAEFKSHYNLMRKYYNLGYIPQDAANIDVSSVYKFYGVQICGTKPGQDEAISTQLGREYKFPQLRTPVVTTGGVTATMTAISAKSKNASRAVMFLDLMASDEELVNLWIHGIEGRHYVKVGPKTITPTKGKKTLFEEAYSQHTLGWAWGNQFLEWLLPTDLQTVYADMQRINETAICSPLLGFNFDAEPIKTELASCASVLTEYHKMLFTGSVDPAVYLPQMIDKLKTAGSAKIVAEKQKQIDAWKAAK